MGVVLCIEGFSAASPVVETKNVCGRCQVSPVGQNPCCLQTNRWTRACQSPDDFQYLLPTSGELLAIPVVTMHWVAMCDELPTNS